MTDIGSNRLAKEQSAYLRQHAENPVHWQPWGRQALDAAKELNRPILLSIGYAACHWCHVMAHESFEDPDVAAVMNNLFVNIKVDREERPDIDQIYMAALGAMGQQGGWPLTMFLRPDGKPFWGGTYFPPQSHHNLPGFVDVLKAVDHLWQSNQDKINHNSEAVFNHLEASLAAEIESRPNDIAIFNQTVFRIGSLFDPDLGGIKGAPKFPNAPFMDALWLSWLYNRDTNHRDTFLKSLETMLQGGIYDHLDGGLCRYSTDEQWLVPHFEKMLYDNAQLIRHVNYAYAETGNELFRIRIEETIDWLLREMRLKDGTFASSLDADSEGEEGKYYVWSEEEIDTVLGENSQVFKEFYGVSRVGNWEGKTILNRLHAKETTSVPPPSLKLSKEKLLHHREKRVHPGRDDKILTDWNALIIHALAEVGRSFARPDWIEHAITAYQAITASHKEGQLPHCQISGQISVKADNHALSSDYAAMINAALALYEATAKHDYLQDAIAFKQALDQYHKDASGNYRLTHLNAHDIILHSYGDYDDAIPSATSQIIEALTRLFLVTGDMSLYESNQQLIEQALGRALAQNYGQIGILNAARIAAEPLSLILAVTNRDNPLITISDRNPDPRRLDKIIVLTGDKKPVQLALAGTVEIENSSAFLCKGHVCLPPVESADALQILLSGQTDT